MRLLQVLLLVFISFVLTACQQMAPSTASATSPSTISPSWSQRKIALTRLQQWQLNGKIAVQTAQDAGSASVDWLQAGKQYTISLFGPLGTHGMKLQGHPQQVTLTFADGKQYNANNPEELLAQQWGFRVPVSYLHYWIRGLPVPMVATNTMQFDDQHRLSSLSQQEWQVQFLGYTRVGTMDLPEKITITSAALKTKIVIYQWRV